MCDHSSPLHRARSSPYEAVSVTFAENTVLEQCHEPEKEEIIGSKLTTGRIVAEDIYSQDDLPPVRTSIMDGYAIKCEGAEKYRENRPLKVIGISCAGEPTQNRVESGTCARISTGAPVPEGADAVIKVENTKVTLKSDTEELEIVVDEEVFPGHNIREPGSDISKGQLLLKQGSTIHPAELGVLLAAGWGHRPVPVYKKPKIVVMSTGSELVDPSQAAITTSNVKDTNRPQLLALFNKHGAEAIDGGIGVDTREATIDCIVRSFGKADIVVSSGSVSMGEKDLLKNILEKNFDFKIHFGRIMMKPGLPCTFASGVFEGKRKLFFALPGNPVSSLVCAQLFVLPALYKMSGRGEGAAHHRILVKLTQDVTIGDRPEFMRGTLTFSVDPFDLSPKVQLFHNQRSSRLLSAVGSNVLVEMPSSDQHGSKQMEKGTIVKAIIMGSVGNS